MNNYLFNQTRLRRGETEARFELCRAFDRVRDPSAVKRSDRQFLEPEAGRALAAVNREARIRWGQAVCQGFADYFNIDKRRPYPTDERLFFVTLADRGCFTSADEREVDVASFIKHLRPGLQGLSYIGMLEPAYYVNIVPTAFFPDKRALFWHLHAICWGETAKQLRKRIAELNKSNRYRPIADGIPAAHQKRIPRKYKPTYHLAVKLGYMLKSPRKAYRLYQADWETVDGNRIAGFKQKKAPLRPGERVTLFHQLKDQYLDRLALAGGDGVAILRRAKRLALRDFKDANRRPNRGFAGR